MEGHRQRRHGEHGARGHAVPRPRFDPVDARLTLVHEHSRQPEECPTYDDEDGHGRQDVVPEPRIDLRHDPAHEDIEGEWEEVVEEHLRRAAQHAPELEREVDGERAHVEPPPVISRKRSSRLGRSTRRSTSRSPRLSSSARGQRRSRPGRCCSRPRSPPWRHATRPRQAARHRSRRRRPRSPPTPSSSPRRSP